MNHKRRLVSSSDLNLPAGRRGQDARRPRLSEIARAVSLLAAMSAGSAAWAQPPNASQLPQLKNVVSGATVLAPVTTATGGTLTIDQTAANAIIQWNSFNVGSGYTVRFIQPSSTAAALNRIFDSNPSSIFGKIDANGQIYLINQNGIIFGAGSQINVGGLIASTLNLTNSNFLQSLSAETIQGAYPTFYGGYDQSGNPTAGPSTAAIQIGSVGDAPASAPQISANSGGRIFMFAPEVLNNSGVLSAPNGQVILAGGNAVYLYTPGNSLATVGYNASAGGSWTSGSLRGYLVDVASSGGPAASSSLVQNSGTINVDRGNATLAALVVNQDGRISANSAALFNGSIYLQAGTISTNAGSVSPGQSGTVTFGPGSVTSAGLDTSDPTTVPASQTITTGMVYATGQTINVEGTISAPSGTINLTGSATPFNTSSEPLQSRIYLGPTAVLDVSGDWASVPANANLQTIKVTSNELANAPDQKGGILEGATVTVNLDAPSTILDLSGYQQGQLLTLAEQATTGGTVNLAAGDVISRAGSVINANGGGLNYAAGSAATTLLLASNNNIYSINSAPENLQYVDILNSFQVNHPRWGITETFNNLLFNVATSSPAFAQGSAGGTININPAGSLVLSGTMSAQATVGPAQLNNAPRSGTLTISQGGIDDYGVANLLITSSSADPLGAGFTATSALPTSLLSQTVLSVVDISGATNALGAPQVSFDTINVNAINAVNVASGTTLSLPTGGSLLASATSFDIAGKIVVPAGTVRLVANPNPSQDAIANPAANLGTLSEGITLESGSAIVTSGVWLNNDTRTGTALGATLPFDMAAISSTSSPVSTENGGTITLSSTDTNLKAGSLLDVSGGGQISAGSLLSGGAGGAIVVTTPSSYIDLGQTSTSQINGSLRGFSLSTGGSVSIVASSISIGGTHTAGGWNIAPDFFQNGGFSSFNLIGAEGVTIARGTIIDPETKSYLINPAAAASLVTGGDLEAVAQIVLLPEFLRPAASISLSAPGAASAPLLVGAGSQIVTDPKGSISLAAADGMTIDGTLSAPGGTINLTVSGSYDPNSSPSDGAAVPLVLGSSAIISTAGTFVASPVSSSTNASLVQGSVLSGGTVSITTTNSELVANAGSLIDVSGTSHAVDLSTNNSSNPYVLTAIGSNAGLVTVNTTDGALFNGTLLANAGNAQSAGGSFSLMLTNRNGSGYAPSDDLNRRIVVTQTAGTAIANSSDLDADIAVNTLSAAGFDKIHLISENTIDFQGKVDANFLRGITLDTAELLLAPNARVTLDSTEVALQNSFAARIPDTVDGNNGSSGYQTVAPSATIATSSGDGVLRVNATNIDLYGALTINGVQQTTLSSSSDIRFSGRQISTTGLLIGSLTTSGNLTMQASQIYPTTRSSFTISIADQPDTNPADLTLVPGGTITVLGNATPQVPIFSAGGSLTLAAANIDQGGTIRAPLGQITLNASDSLTLESHSVTSVSAAGEIIPYGETNAGVEWQYTTDSPYTALGGTPITAPPAKAITLSAPSIDQKPGATINISGGGDILGIEFVPGSGGSSDVLIQPNTYAIIPAAQFTTSPYDPDIANRANTGTGFSPTQSRDGSIYNQIQIGAGGVVPAGSYVLLPGTYALLPGAYLVQLQTGSAYQNLQTNQVLGQPNGLNILEGRLGVAGTSIASSTTVGVIVQAGQDAFKYSDYNLFGSGYFAQQAAKYGTAVPQLPADAGQLSIDSTVATSSSVTPSLSLGGNIISTPAAGGASATVDISAPNIAIVNSPGQAGVDPGFLQVSASQLSGIDGNILIGGTRTVTSTGITVTATASNVEIANTAADPLTAPELLLTAGQSITVESGAVLAGSGKVKGEAQNITADPSGALIRLANAGPVTVTRANPSNASGVITIDAGATLSATGSILLDATQSTQINGTLSVAKGGALSLDAPNFALGDTGGLSGFGGLSLNNAQLAQLNGLGSLILSSSGTIGFYGPLTLGNANLKSLTLDTDALIGQVGSTTAGAGPVNLVASNVILQNSAGNSYQSDASAVGTLNIVADNLTVGAGSKTLTGFTGINIATSGDITLTGSGTLYAGANLGITAQRIIGQSGASQTWNATSFGNNGPVTAYSATLSAATGTASTATNSNAGAQWTLNASSITDAIPVVFHSGSITFSASGTGAGQGITLANGAVLDTSGASENFNGRVLTADAGSVQLNSATQVALATGSTIDVSANAAGGNAGSLSIAAQSLALGGTMHGSAAASAEGGQASIDLVNLGSFSQLNTALAAGGFNGALAVRARSGDITLAASDDVVAHQVSLTADTGAIDVYGTIDASGLAGGGSVSLFAQTGLTLESGSLISVRGTSTSSAAGAASSSGGKVDIETRSGTLSFDAGATIDLRPGATGSAGSAVLIAPRTAGNDGLQASLAGTIVSVNSANANAAPATVLIEGQKVYNSSAPSVSDIAGYASDSAYFLANNTTSLNQIAGDGHVVLASAVEIDSTGDLTLSLPNAQVWDLTSGNWAAGANAGGTLTLRAAGNLIVDSALGLPNDSVPSAPTWAIRLVGGADLSSANPLAVQSLATLQANNTGNVLLPTANSKVRGGTGDITLVAGNDFTISNNQAVIYTLGLAATNDPFSRYLEGGGNISITAQGDASGVSNEWISDWLRRPIVAKGLPLTAGWWVIPANFQQNIGSFAGGSISVAAGGDINNLSAMSASAGLVNPTTGALTVYGGGNLAVSAGGNIIGGNYLVSQGQGTIKAGGSIGLNTSTQLFEMGVNTSGAASGATIDATAGQSITLQSIADPTALYLTKTNQNDIANGNLKTGLLTQYSTFFNYAPTTATNLIALGGKISVGTTVASAPGLNSIDTSGIATASLGGVVLPPNLELVAWNGNVQGIGIQQIVTYPSSVGQVSVLAADNVTNFLLVASDLAPSSIPNIDAPSRSELATVNAQLQNAVLPAVLVAAQQNPATTDEIVARTTTQPFAFDIQALDGSITTSNFTLPAAARIWAGDNIDLSQEGNSWSLENLTASDVSIVQANSGLITLGNGSIHIAGPGQLLVQAGKTIDLGTNLEAISLDATGAATNLSLPTATSARITLVAGVTGNVDLANLNSAFAGVRAAGESTIGTPAEHAAAAVAAMDSFFGSAKISGGDIDTYETSVQTSEASGIDLIAPAGNITVGLTTAPVVTPGSPGNSSNGIITNSGAINSFLSGDFTVNAGKVVTARGGDITIFTTGGNIDAGRGAKTSFTATSFTTQLINNVLVTTVNPGVAGSGIRTVTTPAVPGDPSPPASGNIYLFAPAGYVNAGEAGIASGGNIFIAAAQVLNATNISAAGSSVGVPTVQSGSLSSTLASSGAVGASATDTAAANAAQDAANRAAAAIADSFTPSILSVEVLGFGPKQCKEGQTDCLKAQ